jgi:hypothetical protein
MGNRKISSDLKECALKLWNLGWDIEDICDALGVSRASIYRWEAIFAECGTVKRPPSPIYPIRVGQAGHPSSGPRDSLMLPHPVY